MGCDLRLQGVQHEIQYAFTDESKIWEALQAPGAIINRHLGETHLPEGNKRLALVGDSVLRMALVEAAYASAEYRGPTQDKISSVACNHNLSNVGREHYINKYINLAPGTMAVSNGTMATTVEAIIGAVYVDGGLGAAKQIMKTLGLL